MSDPNTIPLSSSNTGRNQRGRRRGRGQTVRTAQFADSRPTVKATGLTLNERFTQLKTATAAAPQGKPKTQGNQRTENRRVQKAANVTQRRSGELQSRRQLAAVDGNGSADADAAGHERGTRGRGRGRGRGGRGGRGRGGYGRKHVSERTLEGQLDKYMTDGADAQSKA